MPQQLDGGPTRAASPSSWRHRLPVALLALVGLVISAYLALFQLQLVGRVWDPFFSPESSRAVLDSTFSRALPIPDALLGAANYALELGLELTGPQDRWASRPWVVLVFGLVVAAAAIVSMLLIALQATAVGSWCGLCLISAAIALLIPALARAEVLAAVGAVRRARRCGRGLLQALTRGQC